MTTNPSFVWCPPLVGITSAACWLFAVFTAIAAAMSLGSYVYADSAFGLVKQHFAEPSSTYPAATVALFFLSTAALFALAVFYLHQLHAIVCSTKFTPANAARMRAMAWSMLAMHAMLYPVGQLALAVEIAFKGPTSEVNMAYGLIAFLALFTAFALAGFCSKAVERDGFGVGAWE